MTTRKPIIFDKAVGGHSGAVKMYGRWWYCPCIGCALSYLRYIGYTDFVRARGTTASFDCWHGKKNPLLWIDGTKMIAPTGCSGRCTVVNVHGKDAHQE